MCPLAGTSTPSQLLVSPWTHIPPTPNFPMTLPSVWKSFGTSARGFQRFPSHCTGPGAAEMILECYILEWHHLLCVLIHISQHSGVKVTLGENFCFLLSVSSLMLPFLAGGIAVGFLLPLHTLSQPLASPACPCGVCKAELPPQ